MFRKRSLPSGYKFTGGSRIDAEEVIDLWQHADNVYGHPDHALSEWEETVQYAMVALGVRDRRRNLVGFGTIIGDPELGHLNHLSVHPDHRHQGIGRALVKERVKIADKLDIQVVQAYIAPSNTLKSLYIELGFRAIEETGTILEREAPSSSH